MTFPDRRLERPLEPPETPNENVQDVVPPTERNQDPGRSTHDLVSNTSRPLTDEERKAADRDAPASERVYAPASERVPREPVPGHRDFLEHPDQATPERQAVANDPHESEPSFTRVPRPSANPDDPAEASRWLSSASNASPPLVPMGIGWMLVCAVGGAGIWMWVRWRREQNRPINRLRRQAQEARQRAYKLRERIPEVEMPDDAARPAIGLGTALISLAVLWWQQSQARTRAEEMRNRRLAAQTLSGMDWQKRLLLLKDLWSARRVELEKVYLTRK